jgi:hypothetical protein
MNRSAAVLCSIFLAGSLVVTGATTASAGTKSVRDPKGDQAESVTPGLSTATVKRVSLDLTKFTASYTKKKLVYTRTFANLDTDVARSGLAVGVKISPVNVDGKKWTANYITSGDAIDAISTASQGLLISPGDSPMTLSGHDTADSCVVSWKVKSGKPGTVTITEKGDYCIEGLLTAKRAKFVGYSSGSLIGLGGAKDKSRSITVKRG